MSNRPIFIILLSAYVLSSCGPSQSSLATSVSETELAKPTRTQVIPTATETQEPTRTPIPPTATVPVPDILSSFFINAEVQLYDPFDKNIGWGVGCDCQFSEGQFIVNGRNWNGA
jgi:hypothetical protein